MKKKIFITKKEIINWRICRGLKEKNSTITGKKGLYMQLTVYIWIC